MDLKPDLPEKGRYRLRYRGTQCPNCGHPLEISDRYCPFCSQINSTKKLSLKDFFDEFFASFISYDSKLLKTLAALLLKPGKITKDYINGQRVAYTNPFRFLLSLAIIYFLMVNFTGNYSEWDKHGTKADTDVLETIKEYSFISNSDETNGISQQLDSLKNDSDYREFMTGRKNSDSILLSNPSAYFKTLKTENAKLFDKQEFFTVLLRKDSVYTFNDAVTKYAVDETFVNRFAFNTARGLLGIQSRPGSFISTFISKLPFAVFFFLPVFAMFIWVAYIRKKYSYTDHLIFSFHNTALLFILLIISYLIDSIFDVTSNWIFLLVYLAYLFQAMRKFYGQGIFKTILKYLSLNIIFFFLALFAILILFAGNIFVY
ncbi:hypothetical protein LCGC14_0784880 [marine sediment metagenome]|uniref:DUF3667 domain-containing protein n=2 Tax=root TaxID=1 RepID=A0A831QNZ9_9FLAO|nr:DUF3667 domain-containing protein [Pricia antarctica]